MSRPGDVDNPEAVVKPGDSIQVRVLNIDTQERKIGLSMR